MSISKPNPEKTAADRLNKGAGENSSPASPITPSDGEKRGRGRPKGSTNKPKDGSSPEKVKDRTPEEIKQGEQVCAFLSATLWGIAAPMLNHRDITDDEARELGAALDPVLFKYLPGITGYALEINLILVVGTIWANTALPKKTPVGAADNANIRLVPVGEGDE